MLDFSEKGQMCVGGVVGLNASSVTNSGFIGTIDAESTATENKDIFTSKVEKFATIFAGGVVGINQYSEIKNCYADVDYLADGSTIAPEEEDKPLKLYAGIVGSVNIFVYSDGFNNSSSTCFEHIENNYYVQKNEIQKVSYGLAALGQFYYDLNGKLQFEYISGLIKEIDNTVVSGIDSMMCVVETIDDVPLEVAHE